MKEDAIGRIEAGGDQTSQIVDITARAFNPLIAGRRRGPGGRIADGEEGDIAPVVGRGEGPGPICAGRQQGLDVVEIKIRRRHRLDDQQWLQNRLVAPGAQLTGKVCRVFLRSGNEKTHA